jgi:hypothetical protein
MRFDLISAIDITGSAAIVTTMLSFALAPTVYRRIRAACIMALWFAIVVFLGATGALYSRALGPAGVGVAVVVPLIVLCRAWLTPGPAREALLAVPTPALVALNTVRILGISFVLLYAAQRLPAPFAPIAGWGDILIGVTALPVAWAVARGGAGARRLGLVWNSLGTLDLVTALVLGAASAPGPLRVFTDPPGSRIMTELPWVLIPCFAVPALLSLHIALFGRLKETSARA